MRILKVWNKIGVYLLCVIVFLVCWSMIGPKFVTPFNLLNILMSVSLIVIGTIGVTLVITTGGIDLSMAMVYTLTTIVVGTCFVKLHWTIFPTVVIALSIGLICGLTNGLLVAKAKFPAFIATLVTMMGFQACAYLISNMQSLVFTDQQEFGQLAVGKFLGLNIPIWFMIVIIIAGFLLYKYTKFGVILRAIGSNEKATKVYGVNVDKALIVVYIICALCATLGGLISASWTMIASTNGTNTFTLNCISASILGGTLLSGGKGKIFGAVIGALVLGILSTALNMLNQQYYIQYIVTGIILIFSLMMNNLDAVISERRI